MTAWKTIRDHADRIVRVRRQYRVVPHGRRWRIEHRTDPDLGWSPLRAKGYGPYNSRRIRWWHTPYSAMRFVDNQ